jgi:polyribonucleotide nucleotidyltransferase
MHQKFSLPELGLEVEIGKFARQADGSTWIKSGNNIVLSTVVATKEPKEFAGFFPLTVEYRERTSAAGRIPGGYMKREGKLSDIEVLTSRIIDRPIRPLFPHDYFNEVQLLSTVYSSDGKFPTSILSLIGSSLALTISSIPFMGPVGAVQAGKVNGEWKFNVSHEDMATSQADIIIAGTQNGICMVEGNCNGIAEQELVDLLFQAHELIKKQVLWQLDIQKALGVKKAEIKAAIDWKLWKDKVTNFFPENFAEVLFTASKEDRGIAMDSLQSSVLKHFEEDIKNGLVAGSVIKYLFSSLIKDVLPNMIGKKNIRVDGRKLDQVRPIYSEVSTLPCAHGSSLFQRGETQALASLTLGTAQDAQKVETLLGGMQQRAFMLHYNFPPFATGEVKPMRGTGRREIGHGYLAETSFAFVLPSQEEFPYTIRSVVDVLESNGSSSMATVCSTTLALMDAGVPIKGMVSGVAMGGIRDASGKFHILTDILGMEDEFGLMDFKVTGTEHGIMAFQLDIKDKAGLSREVLVHALEQARIGRLHILGEMRKVMTASRADISSLAPRVTAFKIPQDKIGLIIGPSGKNIKEIIAKTGTQIDIEDDGTVKIYSKSGSSALEAESWIKTLCGDIEVGTTFLGTIRRFAEFGIFVEIVAGKDGLIHISSISKNKQRDIDRLYKINDKIKVEVVALDKETGRIRLVAPDLEND